jgi:hypothetical protein
MSDPRTPAEIRYDAERDGTLYAPRLDLDHDPLIIALEAIDALESEWDDPHCVSTDESRPILVERWQNKKGTIRWQNFRIAERVDVGVLEGGTKPGIELTIAGNSINEDLTDIWTLDDLRQLRDDLCALLADDRLLAAAQPADPRITVERPADADCPCTEYHCGSILVEVLDDPKDGLEGSAGLCVYNFGGDFVTLADAQRDAVDLFTLLGDPRVKAAIEARRAA